MFAIIRKVFNGSRIELVINRLLIITFISISWIVVPVIKLRTVVVAVRTAIFGVASFGAPTTMLRIVQAEKRPNP